MFNRGEFASMLVDAPEVAEKITAELEARRASADTGAAT